MNPRFVRVNSVAFSWYSTLFKVDNFPISGVVGCNYEQKRVKKIVDSNVPGAAPLGRTTGIYSVPTFTVRMLRQDADQLAAYVALKSPDGNAVADGTFSFTVQCGEPSLPNQATTAIGYSCNIESVRTVYEESVAALVEEYTLSALQIQTTDSNGTRWLYNSTPSQLDSLAVDYVTIEGNNSPGRATILDPKREIGWDIRQAFAFDIPNLVPKGSPPGTFGIKFDLWTSADLAAWNPYAARYFKRALVKVNGGNIAGLTATTKRLTIIHPILQAEPFKVAECVVTEIGGLNKDETGLWSSTIKFMESGPPRPALQPAVAAIAGIKATQPDAQTQTQRDIQAMQAQIASQHASVAAQTGKGAR